MGGLSHWRCPLGTGHVDRLRLIVDYDECRIPIQASLSRFVDGEMVGCTGLEAEPFGWPNDLLNIAGDLLAVQERLF